MGEGVIGILPLLPANTSHAQCPSSHPRPLEQLALLTHLGVCSLPLTSPSPCQTRVLALFRIRIEAQALLPMNSSRTQRGRERRFLLFNPLKFCEPIRIDGYVLTAQNFEGIRRLLFGLGLDTRASVNERDATACLPVAARRLSSVAETAAGIEPAPRTHQR